MRTLKGARTGPSSTEDIARAMRMEYSQWTRDSAERVMNDIQDLLAIARGERMELPQLFGKALDVAHQQFRFRWLALGTRNRDGFFRYDAFVGLREDAVKARRQEAFRPEDFGGKGKYPGRQISDLTTLYLEEDKPYGNGAEATFNRPALMHGSRHAPDDSLEADFIEVHILGGKNDLIGWIEASGTTTGKLPSIESIRWLEMIASIVGVALSRQRKV